MHTCGECKFHLKRGVCPRAEYRSHKDNLNACLSSDTACELFQPRNSKQNPEEPDMGETLSLLNENFIVICPVDTKELLVFNDGHYVTGEHKIQELLEATYGENLKAHFVEESTKHLQRANYIEREEINKFTNKIPMENGLFNFVTHDLEPFDQKQIFTYKLNVKYDPAKECPKFQKFIKEIMPEENDRLLLQEICGYCLIPAMPYHKLFWLYGIGRNGKDRIILTLEHILGKDNCSHLNLSDLREGRRFSLYQLYGKLLNISSEPNTKYPVTTNILKLISGENTIHAELKGRNKRLRFTNMSKPIVVGNNFPKVNDTSTGFWERVIVLNFPITFTGEECIPNIERTWLEDTNEISGIFNWMLKGAYRLKENRQFTTSKTTEEIKTEFMRVSDPFNAWIAENCNFIMEAYLTRQEAYADFKEYVGDIGATPDSARTFYSKIRQTPRVKDSRIRVEGKIKRVFQGITLKTEKEKELYVDRLLIDSSTVTTVPDVPSFHTPKVTEKYSISKEVQKPVTSGTPVTDDLVDGAFGDGKLPTCFNCRKAVHDPSQLCSLDGQFYCRGCRDLIVSQRRGV